MLDCQDADPKEILVNREKTPESSYLMIEVQTPFETGPPDDLNDKGEVLIGGGIWAGGVWTPRTSPSITGVFPDSVSENFPDGIGYRIHYLGWSFFNIDRKLLQVGEIEPIDGSGSGGGTVCPLFWTVGQSTPSLIYETANLWENLYSSSTPLGVTAGGEMILRCTPIHPPSGSSTVNTRLERFNSAGGVTMDVYSHETGHALGLTVNRSRKGDFHEDDGVDGPDRVKPLMSRTSGNSRWLRHQDWFEANTKAATNIYGH